MAYTKTTWKDRVVEKPLTFTLKTNADGTITLTPAEGTIVDPGTPITASNLNNIENSLVNHDLKISAVENDILLRPKVFEETSNGATIIDRASIALYGTSSPNGNFLVAIQDTAHAQQYLIATVHFQKDSNLQLKVLANNYLTCVTNTLGTISVSGLAGQSKFTIIALSGNKAVL